MTKTELFEFIKTEYNVEPDYPFDDENAVFRHRSNRKWFALVMNIRRDRLLPGEAEYSELLVRRMIENVTIHDDRITVEFKSGLAIDVDT